MILWKTDPVLEDPSEDKDSILGADRDPDANIESDSENESKYNSGESSLTRKDRKFCGFLSWKPPYADMSQQVLKT